MSALDKPQTLLITTSRRYQSLRRVLRSALTALTGYSAFVPDHLTMAPRDLKTADPLAAKEFYRGRFFLGGVLVDTAGKSPFEVVNAENSWLKALHRFDWLRHFSVSQDKLSSNFVRAMVREWSEASVSGHRDVAWHHDTISQRLIAWLYHSDVILTNCDHEFYRLFMRDLATHVRHLIRHAPTMPEGMPRLLAYLALSYASICHNDQQATLKFARDKLAAELSTQILSDGGHVSRNPAVIVEILSLLLPFRQSCMMAGVELKDEVHTSIERMLPALRFFRMGDGKIARFNGAGLVQPDLIATILRHDDILGEPAMQAAESGYQRMVQNDSVVLMDVGNPPKGEISLHAHAGCLSFEFSSGLECIVANCGSPPYPEIEPIGLWRTTAAHSTPIFCDTSSCRFENTAGSGRQLSGQILTRNLNVTTEREDTTEQSKVHASHSGYAREFGALCQRVLTLEDQGNILRGLDQFTAPDKSQLKYSTRDQVEIHFHLHPDVDAKIDATNDSAIILHTRQMQQWKFTCKEVRPSIEEGIFFASLSGSRQRAHRIALKFGASSIAEVNWTFERSKLEEAV